MSRFGWWETVLRKLFLHVRRRTKWYRPWLYTLIARFMGNMEPIWDRQDPCGPPVCPINFATRGYLSLYAMASSSNCTPCLINGGTCEPGHDQWVLVTCKLFTWTADILLIHKRPTFHSWIPEWRTDFFFHFMYLFIFHWYGIMCMLLYVPWKHAIKYYHYFCYHYCYCFCYCYCCYYCYYY